MASLEERVVARLREEKVKLWLAPYDDDGALTATASTYAAALDEADVAAVAATLRDLRRRAVEKLAAKRRRTVRGAGAAGEPFEVARLGRGGARPGAARQRRAAAILDAADRRGAKRKEAPIVAGGGATSDGSFVDARALDRLGRECLASRVEARGSRRSNASFLRARCDVANVTDARFKSVAPQPLQGWAVPDSDVVVGPLPCKTGSTTLRDFVIDRRGGVEIKGVDAFRAAAARGAAFYSSARHPVERFVSGYRQLDAFYKMGWIQKSWFTGACRLAWPEDWCEPSYALRAGAERPGLAADVATQYRRLERFVADVERCGFFNKHIMPMALSFNQGLDMRDYDFLRTDDLAADLARPRAAGAGAAGVAMRTGGSRWAKRMAADAGDARSPHRALARSLLARLRPVAGSTATNQWTLPPEHKLRRFRDFLFDVERAGRFDALLRGAARANATACHAKVERYCAAAKVPVREPVVGSAARLAYFRRGLEEPCDAHALLDFVYAGGARSRVEPWALTRARTYRRGGRRERTRAGRRRRRVPPRPAARVLSRNVGLRWW
ncbi:hypothetical protein SO694_00199025 [Aureococcus anophagefferens]|uniref:Uncharacterized protein n=1 Tax=Aureococcus anophagefferens TaxID=44056 RepID=A0ABR1FP29_AURAN